MYLKLFNSVIIYNDSLCLGLNFCREFGMVLVYSQRRTDDNNDIKMNEYILNGDGAHETLVRVIGGCWQGEDWAKDKSTRQC